MAGFHCTYINPEYYKENSKIYLYIYNVEKKHLIQCIV
jgi:hypothetical protein